VINLEKMICEFGGKSMIELRKVILFVIISLVICELYLKTSFSQTLINEIMSSNITNIHDEYDVDMQNCPVPDCVWWYQQMGQPTYDGHYPDWIEIYNPGTNIIDLTGYGLSDDPSLPYKWVFPHVVLNPGEYTLVFASGKDRSGDYLHTNFKIDRMGETIILTDDTGTICDSVNSGEIPIDFSLGRYPDGGTKWVIFAQPTPAESNNTPPFPGFTDSIQTSHSGGFYSNGISLSLFASSPTAEIRYTLDGNDPSPSSYLYTGPIAIDNTAVVKARTYENSVLSSKILIQTYFINENFTVPVISLSTPPDNLWDDDIGIYVPGKNADENNRIANYWQDWERPVHVEFYEPGGLLGFSINTGIKIFGWGSRQNALKSLSIMLRDRYGQNKVNYKLFPDLPIYEFKSFVLRAAGNDWQKTFFRDIFAISLVKEKNLDTQAYRPAVVFINGEYWGIHNIREKLNEDYLASHHNIDKENVDIVSRYWRRTYLVVIEGDDQAYLAMEDYLKNHDLSNHKHYEYIKTLIDVDNYLDYCVSQIYFANYDWPGNNNKCWRARMPNSKWRWLMYDLDYTFNSNNMNNYRHNTLTHATKPDGSGWPNPPYTTFLLRKMLESEHFRNDFINRFADFMNTIFVKDTVLKKLDEIKAMFEPEMPRHIDRWGWYENTLTSMNDWESNINVLREFAKYRDRYVRGHICDKFSLKGWEKLEFDISRVGGGKIKVNSILIDRYPWNGEYFLGVPIKLSALPSPGYQFTGWTGLASADSLSNTITVNLTGALSLTACFEEDSRSSATIVINEINYNSSTDFDPEDWVELYNPHGSSIDISGWIFKDEDDSHAFIIPKNTIIPRDDYLVLCRNASAFHKLFPGVDNYIGNYSFGLSSNGELVQVFNDQDLVVDSLTYRNFEPWPVEPDGNGPTLSLRAVYLDNSIPQNWGTSLGYGTPGTFNDVTTNVNYIVKSDVPTSLSLRQNYPNPFNAVTNISYSIPGKNTVKLTVYNIHGREVSALVDEVKPAGNYTVIFNASNFSSGLYFFRLEIGSKVITKKMLLLK
jgi:uncharacterized repeat protein (TIGR02543 family)